MESSEHGHRIDEIVEYIRYLEKRLTKLEKLLDQEPQKVIEDITSPKIFQKRSEADNDQLEFRIGQYWFAKVGILALAIGIAFLLTLPYRDLPSYVPSIIGFAVVGILFGLSKAWENKYDLISRYLFGSALLLLYFSIMRLHFWGDVQGIKENSVEIPLLLITTIIYLYIALKRDSIYLVIIGLVLGYLTALLSGEPYIIFVSILIISIAASYLKIKRDWNQVFIFSIVLTYLAHLTWFINNPLIENDLQFVNEPFINIFFLLAYVFIYASVNLFGTTKFEEDPKEIISTILNTAGFMSLFLLILFTKFKQELFISFLIVSILFLVMALVYWDKRNSKYSTFFYSIIGYTSLSIAIIDKTVVPDVFLWLCWQSLLVIVTALWFKSRFIIIANFFIYSFIAFASLIVATNAGWLMLSIGIVALLSARILNYQKSRLNLKTDLMRNAYLVIALVSIPYSLYIMIPSGYMSFSWLSIAIVYYILSTILKNKKYRYMALATFLMTVLYLLIFGITMLESELRVVSFIALGIVLIIVSILYSRKKANPPQQENHT